MKYAPTIKLRLESAIHYVAESMIAGNEQYIKDSSNKLATILSIPAGVLLYLWIRRKTKK